MDFLKKILGSTLILLGLYYIGQNIIFTTQTAPYWWRDIPAAGSVISLVAGTLMLVFRASDIKFFGWFFLVVGAVLVFLSGGVILRPTSLWQFFVSISAMAGGYKLFSS